MSDFIETLVIFSTVCLVVSKSYLFNLKFIQFNTINAEFKTINLKTLNN